MGCKKLFHGAYSGSLKRRYTWKAEKVKLKLFGKKEERYVKKLAVCML